MIDKISLAEGSNASLLPRLDRKLARTIFRRPGRFRPEKAVVAFSFDDVTKTAAMTGAQILAEENARGTFFVASGLLGKQFGSWQFAEMSDVVELHAAGHEIGCHTYSHPDCQLLSATELDEEIASNAAVLEAAMPDLRIRSFAYPYGSVGCRQKLAMMDKFACSRGTHPDINAPNLDLALLNSFTLNDEETPVARIGELIEQAKAARGWLMFHTHDVCDEPTSEGCTPELLRAAIRLAKAADCEVVPIRNALAYVDGQVTKFEAPELAKAA